MFLNTNIAINENYYTEKTSENAQAKAFGPILKAMELASFKL
jgi:hypothetical protein